MKFFFPDSQDQIDPKFDFLSEEHSRHHYRQRDDRYAHEILDPPPYGGLLVSKAMIDRHGGAGRYTAGQRQRFYREGVREFFRLGEEIETLGDCGAFTYIKDEVPPYGSEEVIDFYEKNGFDAGVSVDHLIPDYDEGDDVGLTKWKPRYDLTLELAADFLDRYSARGCSFEPVGVAQGWSRRSYADAVVELQRLGYGRIAIGGLVPLKTPQILTVLAAISEVRAPGVRFHLFGITRCEHVNAFSAFGVDSFDSTSPFRRAFKDSTHNYYWGEEGALTALRVPQVERNSKLAARIGAGEISQERARELEQRALAALRGFDRREVGLEEALDALCDYQDLHDDSKRRERRREEYRETLAAAPWQKCRCQVCKAAGIEVVIFRGSERNKRRGFHNMRVFADRRESNGLTTDAYAKLPAAA